MLKFKACAGVMLFTTVCAFLIAEPGCGPPPAPVVANKALEPLTPRMAGVFDNTIQSPAELAPLEGPRRQALAAAASLAEFVLPCRITTVTTQTGRPEPTYTLSLSWIGAPIDSAAFPSPNVTLVIDPAGPAYPLVRGLDLGLVGTNYIALLRRFSTNDGPTMRWVLIADTPEARQTLRNARLMLAVTGN